MAGQLVPLGEIVATHGLDGRLKLNLFNPDSDTLAAGVEVCLDKDARRSLHQIESCRQHKQQLLIKLLDVSDIDSAARLIGSTLLVDEALLDELHPGEYYLYQVVGFAVFDSSGSAIGTVTGTFSTAGGELYVVQGPEKEHMIPAVRDIIEKVDFAAKKLIINPPPGLLDL
jgi:16S rRNA processing protein RimM